MDEDAGKALAGCLTLIVILAIGFLVGGLCIQYTLEYWISYHKAEAVDISFWMCGIIGLFLGWNLGIVSALVTWIVSLFIAHPLAAGIIMGLPLLC